MNNIRTHNCNTCSSDIKVNLCDKTKDLYYFFCYTCLQSINVCSKKHCNELFLLNNDNDLKNLKTIYIINSNSKFYLYDDVIQCVIRKYGSFDSLKIMLKEKKKAKKAKVKKLESGRKEREQKLKELFMLNKLEFRNHGYCYEYIQYGKHDLDFVLNSELNRLKDQNIRQNVLAGALRNINIPLDQNLKSCYEYINDISTKPLNDIVKCIELEYNLKNNKYCDLENNNTDVISKFNSNNICV